ncbi:MULTISPECIES: hypothetical protein [unclassified Mycolicibacterium]|uniref:hypothetical protein n=1 Tax=unclassified Mycolicibacterium TaxID=2636767 RepID=UPI002ED87B1A
MAWTKIPAAAASIACAACIAAATAVPGAEMQAAHLAKAVSGDVQFTALEDVLGNFLDASLQLASLDGIAPLLNFAFPGDDGDPLSAFVPGIVPGWPGYAALSALWFYQNTFTGNPTYAGIEGISAFSGIPGYLNALGGDFSGVSVFDGITSFQNFPDQGLHAFVPVDPDFSDPENPVPGQAGYAALSGLYFYKNFVTNGFDTSADGLGGIDAFSALPLYKDLVSGDEETRDEALRGLDSVSAIPEYKTLLSRDATVGQRADALRSIDAFSAIPVYLGLPTAEEEEAADLTAVAKTDIQATPEKTEVTSSSEQGSAEQPKSSKLVTALSNVTPPAAESVEAGAPAAAPAAPAAASAPAATDTSSGSSGKQSNGSYSGVFKPNNPVVLFGTGKGGGADNGIRGWDKVANGIRGALGLPKDNSGSSDSGSSSGGE